MIEKWKHALDKSKIVGTIFMDPSKALDRLNHNLLLATLMCISFPSKRQNLVKAICRKDFKV